MSVASDFASTQVVLELLLPDLGRHSSSCYLHMWPAECEGISAVMSGWGGSCLWCRKMPGLEDKYFASLLSFPPTPVLSPLLCDITAWRSRMCRRGAGHGEWEALQGGDRSVFPEPANPHVALEGSFLKPLSAKEAEVLLLVFRD